MKTSMPSERSLCTGEPSRAITHLWPIMLFFSYSDGAKTAVAGDLLMPTPEAPFVLFCFFAHKPRRDFRERHVRGM